VRRARQGPRGGFGVRPYVTSFANRLQDSAFPRKNSLSPKRLGLSGADAGVGRLDRAGFLREGGADRGAGSPSIWASGLGVGVLFSGFRALGRSRSDQILHNLAGPPPAAGHPADLGEAPEAPM
jgi:hypothetical protein